MALHKESVDIQKNRNMLQLKSNEVLERETGEASTFIPDQELFSPLYYEIIDSSNIRSNSTISNGQQHRTGEDAPTGFPLVCFEHSSDSTVGFPLSLKKKKTNRFAKNNKSINDSQIISPQPDKSSGSTSMDQEISRLPLIYYHEDDLTSKRYSICPLVVIHKTIKEQKKPPNKIITDTIPVSQHTESRPNCSCGCLPPILSMFEMAEKRRLYREQKKQENIKKATTSNIKDL